MKNMKMRKKNGSNRYVIRWMSSNVFVFDIIIFICMFWLSISMLKEEYFFMRNIEICLTILGLFSLIVFFVFYLLLYFFQIVIVDFNNEYFQIKQAKSLLKDVFKIEYIKKNWKYHTIKVSFKENDIELKYYVGPLSLEKQSGYPMARKIEEINNKLQEYRKQNNLD